MNKNTYIIVKVVVDGGSADDIFNIDDNIVDQVIGHV